MKNKLIGTVIGLAILAVGLGIIANYFFATPSTWNTPGFFVSGIGLLIIFLS